MRASTFLIPIGLPSLVIAQTYALQDDYEPTYFFDMFDFFTVSGTGHHPALSADSFIVSRPDQWVCIVCGPGNRAERWLDRYQQRIRLHGCR
jgi:hypothetical protein